MLSIDLAHVSFLPIFGRIAHIFVILIGRVPCFLHILEVGNFNITDIDFACDYIGYEADFQIVQIRNFCFRLIDYSRLFGRMCGWQIC